MSAAPEPANAPSGLSAAEAERRLRADGYNELPQANRRTPLRIVIEVLREPMLALLIGGGLIYLLLGDIKEAVILLVFACLSVAITVVQEARTERVLEALRDLTSPRALVIRDGERRRIPGREVVRGDVVILAEGDRVPADARLTSAEDLQADESLLTGESVPVRKAAVATAIVARPGGDDLPYVYSGTLIVRGSGTAEVVATGASSEIGRIGTSLNALETEAPHLQIQMRRLVSMFAVFGGLVSLTVVILYGLLRDSWLDAVLAGIAVGMSMLPEEFPMVLTVFLAMGAWRISQARVLTRRATAIEALGSATVLCSDKTGTLTENHMRIAAMRTAAGETVALDAGGQSLSAAARKLAVAGALASALQPFDPMEKALQALARQGGAGADRLPDAGWTLVKAYALRPGLLAMTQVWKDPDADGDLLMLAAKGAPEAIAGLCNLDAAVREMVTRSVDEMAAAGLRVLGVARGTFSGADLPDTQQDFALEFLGLVGFADPLRASAAAAVSDCRAAGIRVVMITGDYPATARSIARDAGLEDGDTVTGDDLRALSDDELAARIGSVSVFARIAPEQKLRIVEALKQRGDVVAMTGDGVNDAPSLKAAHIGVAMGGRGTDVAREAAAIILLDDDFGAIVTTIRLGRRIFDNLRKAMCFIFAVHVPIAGLALLPLIFGLPILFGPVHIAFLEMIIDPVCSLVFEAETEEDDVMRRPPRDPAEPLFSLAMIVWSLFQGAVVLVLVAGIFVIAYERGMPEAEVRALTFFSLVISILALIFVNRSSGSSVLKAFRRPNRALWIVVPAVAVMLTLSLLWPTARDLFRFGPLHVDDLTLTLGAGVAILVVLESCKPLWRRLFARAAAAGETP